MIVVPVGTLLEEDRCVLPSPQRGEGELVEHTLLVTKTGGIRAIVVVAEVARLDLFQLTEQVDLRTAINPLDALAAAIVLTLGDRLHQRLTRSASMNKHG
jgi:hypothetical protein